jgi:ribose 5-phosphate isomerase RpiB
VSGTTEAAVIAAASAAKARGIRVYTIGVGSAVAGDPSRGINAALLRAMASHPSMFYLEPDAEALGRIYGEIARTLGCSAADIWGGR